MTSAPADLNFAVFVALWNRLQGQGTPTVHFRIALWLEEQWRGPRRRSLLMAFRSCGKSTLVGLFCAWLLWRNPDLRILVLAADLALARKMVRNVKRIIERHPLTAKLKPDRADQWGGDRFTVRRTLELRDPSMLAKSITTNITGTRADVVICDDVEVPKTCDTAWKREEMRERLLELDYILVPGGAQLYVGTPHSWFTLYADEPRRDSGEDREFLHGFERLVIPVWNETHDSVWPERFSRETIEATAVRTGPAHFSSQMLCRPVSISEGRLDPDALGLYDDELSYCESGCKPVLSLGGRKLVSASCFWDPAYGREGGDRSIVAVVYCDADGGYFLHHVAVIAVDPRLPEDPASQQCRQVARLARRFHLPSVALESNGLGKFLPGLLRKALGEEGVMCPVRELTSRRPKQVRILEAFDAILAARALHVHRSVLQTPFIEEMREWQPGKNGGHDDALDAVAGALSLQPVRIGRVYGLSRASWTGSSQPARAASEFNVME